MQYKCEVGHILPFAIRGPFCKKQPLHKSICISALLKKNAKKATLLFQTVNFRTPLLSYFSVILFSST